MIGLALGLIFLLPGNLLWFALALMLFSRNKTMKWEPPAKFFMVWLVWALISCLCSEHRMVALFGSMIRMEGFVMWVIIARLAWAYWSSKNAMSGLIFPMTVMFLIYIAASMYFKMTFIHWAAVASFGAMFSVIVWEYSPWAIALILPFILVSQCRGGLIAAFCGIMVNVLMKNFKRAWWFLAIAVCALVISQFMPIGQKIRHMNIETLGNGSRSHWIMQSSEVVKRFPLTGCGLDNEFFYLTNGPRQLDGVPDKTHNIFMDMLMMTGWVGYTLFLFSIGSAIGIAIKFPSRENIVCLSVLATWLIFGLLNPCGSAAHAIAVISIFGIRRPDDI